MSLIVKFWSELSSKSYEQSILADEKRFFPEPPRIDWVKILFLNVKLMYRNSWLRFLSVSYLGSVPTHVFQKIILYWRNNISFHPFEDLNSSVLHVNSLNTEQMDLDSSESCAIIDTTQPQVFVFFVYFSLQC